MLDTTGTALLTIRAWCEEGSRPPLRVEVRVARDVALGYGSTQTFVRTDDVVEVVRDFLDGVLCSSHDDPHVTPGVTSPSRLSTHDVEGASVTPVVTI